MIIFVTHTQTNFMTRRFILLLILIILAGCQPVLKKLYGIKKPSVEDGNSIRKKAMRFGLDTTNLVAVSSSDFLMMMKGRGIPDGAIYDSGGRYIEYRQTDSSCNAGLFEFIPALQLTGSYNRPDSLPLHEVWKKLRDLKGHEMAYPGSADFYLLIYWTVWTGRLNKDHVKIWEDLARQNKNCRIQVVKVNLDIQECWDETLKNELVKAMRK